MSAKENDQNSSAEYKTGGWRAHYVLIVCTLLYVINYMDRQVFAVILQPMKIDLGLTDAQCGLASTVLILGMAFFSFPVSHLIDRWSRRKAIGIMAILWSGFTFATGLAKNFTGVLIPRAFVGLGEAGFVPGGTAMISASYPKERRGWAMGIFHIAIPLGAAAGVILGGLISAKMGWRAPFLFFAIPGVILGIMAFFMKDYKTADDTGTQGGIKNFFIALRNVLRLPTMRWYYLALGIAVFMTSSVLVWLPSLMMRMLNISEDKAWSAFWRNRSCRDYRRSAGRVSGRFLAKEKSPWSNVYSGCGLYYRRIAADCCDPYALQPFRDCAGCALWGCRGYGDARYCGHFAGCCAGGA